MFILDKKPTYFEKRKIKNKSVGQKSLWIFAPRSKTDKRREQKQRGAAPVETTALGVKRFCPPLTNY